MATTTQQQQQAEQMRIHWNVRIHPLLLEGFQMMILSLSQFIQGMLTNLSALPLDRIHSMLKFAPDYDQSIEQLSAFMEAAKREGMVVVRDGMWSLAPK
jgi:anaphase-promoting complex subunit 2